MQKKLLWLLPSLAVALGYAPFAAAQATATKAAAKAVLGKYQDAIVAVKLVVKINSKEMQMEVAGTVLTPAGLTVISDSNSNPGRLFGEEGGGNETTDVQLLFKDGRELPAKFVLRDRDLDLAFVMPTEKGLNLTHVKLDKTPVPDVLDELIYLHRLGKALNREASVTLGNVSAVIKKPRILIVPDGSYVQNLGCPVFDAQGRAVGLVLMKRGATGGRAFSFSMQTVIITAEDVQQVASQVGKDKDDDKED